jgi:holo-[acyl-carrier protein] synthase
MSVHVGLDLVAAEQIRESIARHGDRFLERVYTPAERAASGDNASRLAAGFAVKEATMKALGRTEEALGWRSIEVIGGADGDVSVRLTGGAAALAAARGVTNVSVSLTRRRRNAAAVVVTETADDLES